MGRRRVDVVAPGARRVVRSADGDLRSASGIVGARARGGQPLSHVSRDGGAARPLRAIARLHAHRAAAGDGAPVLRIVGVSGARLLRPDVALRSAGGLQTVRGRGASRWPRRDPRLGAGTLSEGCARPRALRRDGAVRARRPAPGRAPGLGHADLQLRPQRGAQLPPVERAVLARGVPRGRTARRRGGVDAVSRLLAARRRVDSEQVRRPREPRGDQLSAGVEQPDARRASGHAHRRGGIDGVHRRQPARAPRRPRVHLQVEHGVDARHPSVHARGSGASPLASQPGDLLGSVHAHRELHPAVLARRGGARQALAPRQAAGRRMAEARGASDAVRLHVRPPGQEAAVHGQRVRAVARVEFRRQPRLAPARRAGARGDAPLHPGSELALLVGTRAARSGLRPVRLPVDRLQRQREQRRVDRALREIARRLRGDGLQLHAGAADGVPRRRP